MLAAKMLAGVAPEVNLRGRITHVLPLSVNKASHSGFETHGRCHQKSKIGLSVVPQDGLMSSKIFLKNLERHHFCLADQWRANIKYINQFYQRE